MCVILGLLGPISGYRVGAHVKKNLIDIVENSLLSAKRACRILGLKPKRFYRYLIANYGNEAEHITPSELAGNEFFYDATSGERVVGGVSIVYYKFYGRYLPFDCYIKPSRGYALGLNTQGERIAYMKERWAEFVFRGNLDELPTYVRLTCGDKTREAEFLGMPQWFSERKNCLDSSPMYSSVYVNPDFELYIREDGR